MKNTYSILIVLLFNLFSLNAQSVISKIENEVETQWLGFGYNQWGHARQADGNTLKPWDSALWNLTKERIMAIKPSLVRLPLDPSWFMRDDNGDPLSYGVYNWNGKHMQSFYKIMDLYKEHNIPVLSGMWGTGCEIYNREYKEFYSSSGENSFANLQADLIKQLVITKGYTNISCYTPTNEPLGTDSDYELFSKCIKNLYNELSKRGLPNDILIGADSWGDWVWKPAQYNKNELCGYDFHNYLNNSPYDTSNWLYNRVIETFFDEVLTNINKYDDSKKPIYVSEMAPIGVPFIDWPIETAPAHCKVDTYEYGLGFFDYGIQLARSGMSSGLAWGLDGFNWNKNAGMWNNSGNNGGLMLRPWYYAWQLMCRYFPKGAKILKMTEIEGRKDLRILGARIEEDYTFAIVNRRMDAKSKDQLITLKVDNLNKPLYVYDYNRLQCGDGISLTLPYRVINNGALDENELNIEVSLESAILLTTLPPLELLEKEKSEQLNINFDSDVNYSLIDNLKNLVSVSVVNNPRKKEPNTSDKVCQVIAIKPNDNSSNMDDLYGFIIPESPIAIKNENHYLNFQSYKNVASDVTFAIKFDELENLQGYSFTSKSRIWEDNSLDLSPYVGKTIKYIVVFPDRKLSQSVNNSSYVAIDNIVLGSTSNEPKTLENIILHKEDIVSNKTLDIDFEYINPVVAIESMSDALNAQVVANPKKQDLNESDKCCKATLFTNNTSINSSDLKYNLNIYPHIKISDANSCLWFQVYRSSILADLTIEVTLSSKQKYNSTFNVDERRVWTNIGIDLSQFKDEYIENIAIYPNVNYLNNNIGTYDDSYYDNLKLNNNNPVGGIYDIELNDYKVYSSNSNIIVNGAIGCDIMVYSINGNIVYKNNDISNSLIIPLEKGIYFVKLDSKIYKVIN